MILTPEQSIAARGLLRWKAKDLSTKSETDYTTVCDFERGVRNLRIDTLKKLMLAFKNAGIRFFEDDEKIGVELLKISNDL